MKTHKLVNEDFNGEKFKSFVKNFMDNLKKNVVENCYFIMYNVRFHKIKIDQVLILDYVHIIMYLPPYSPFLDPIEKCNSENNLFNQQLMIS